MTPDAATHIEPDVGELKVRDRVRVPDGRVGIVTGFFRRDEETVLVRFAGSSYDRLPASGITKL